MTIKTRPKTAVWPRLLRGETGLLAASTLIAALTLMWPFSVRSDAVYWMLWGRELTQFTLDTGSSWTSWKPLPIPFTTVYSLFGDTAASTLWMLTSRATTFFAAMLVFRLVQRLSDEALKPLGVNSKLPGVMGGLLASLWLLRILAGFTAIGYSEGLMLSLVLLATVRALDGRHHSALLFGFAACLGRPEPLALMMAYGLWLWFKRPELRGWIAAGPIVVLGAWFMPDWIGSGDPMRARYLGGVKRVDVHYPGDGKPLLMAELAFTTLPSMAMYAIALGLAGAFWQARLRRFVPLALAGVGLLWIVLVVIQVAGGANGLPRYMFGAQTCLVIVGGFGISVLVGLLAKWIEGAGVPAKGALAIPVVLALLLAGDFIQQSLYPKVVSSKRLEANFAAADDTLTDAINAVGGPKRVIACGPVARFPLFDPTIAWKLGGTSSVLSISSGPDDPLLYVPFSYGTTFRLNRAIARPPQDLHAPPRIAPKAKRVTTAGGWAVYQRCLKDRRKRASR